nr:MAG TPA: hypothetical protein [Bacteriophage sp.]
MASHCVFPMRIFNLHELWMPKRKKARPFLAAASCCQRRLLLRNPKQKKLRWKS